MGVGGVFCLKVRSRDGESEVECMRGIEFMVGGDGEDSVNILE